MTNDAPLYTEPTAQTPNTYSPNAISSFTFKNLTEISVAMLENNFTGNATNVTMTYNTTHYTYQINLPAGTYQYRFVMNGTTNIWNHTNPQIFTINKAASPIYLAINDNQTTAQTYPYGTNTITAGWKNFTENVLILYKNNNIIQTLPLVSEVITLAARLYNYTLHYRENRNYTQNRTETTLTITKVPSTCAISFAPNTPQNYGTSITIFANTSAEASHNSSIQLLQNGTQKASGNGNRSYAFAPATGIYNFSAYCSGNENYTESATTDNNYVINKASPTLTVGLNTTSPQNYGKPILLYGNISAGSGDQSATVTIYQNGTQVASGAGNQTYGILLGAGIHEFNVTYSESQNYMSGSINQTGMTINRLAPTLNLTLNGTETDIIIASCEPINATATIGNPPGISIWLRNTTQNNTEMFLTKGRNATTTITLCGQPGYQFNFTALYNETQNYTSATKTLFATIDSEKPTYANNATNEAPINDTQWSANFTIDWSDNKNIGSAWLENNFTGNMTNNTMGGNGLYYYNTTLMTSAYQYRFAANDTSGNWNATSVMTFTLATTTTTTTVTTTTRGGTGGFPPQQQATTTTTIATTTSTSSTTTTTTVSEMPVIRPEKLPLIRELIEIASQSNTTGNEKPSDAITGLVTKNPVAAAVSLILLIAIAANYAMGVEPIRHAATAVAKKLGLKKLLKLKK